MHMIRIRSAILLAATIALTAACSTPPTVSTGVQPQAAQVAVGATQDSGSGAKLTLHELRDNLTRGTYEPNAGNRWVGIDIEACIDQTGPINSQRWQIRDTANHVYTPGVPFDDMPAAGYEDGTQLVGGQCLRGWLPYQIPVAETIAAVQYTAPNGNTITWMV